MTHRLIGCSLDALTKYQSATGAVSDASTGLLRITAAQYASLKSLFYKIGSVSDQEHIFNESLAQNSD